MTDQPVIPPVNQQAEQSVLGTLLAFYTPAALNTVQATKATWHDFYWTEHQLIYRAITRLHDNGEHVDPVTVARLIEKHGRTTDRTAAVIEMCVASATPAGLREHAAIVAEDGRWRRWLDATHDAQDAIFARNEDDFWNAVGSIRDDAPKGLRVVEPDTDRRAA